MTERHHLPLLPLSEPLTRRAMLALASAAGLAAACGPNQPPQPVEVGACTDFPVGTWTLVTQSNLSVIVAHDTAGYYAYSAICTHEACTINPPDDSGQSVCGCHNSLFGGNGEVLRGPATHPLAHYAVTISADCRVTVDPGMIVTNSARTTEPTMDAGSDAGTDATAGEAGDAAVDAAPPGRDIGPVENFPMGTFTVVTRPLQVFVGHDADGLWVLSATCTHFGFPLTAPVSGVITCSNTPTSMHGSTYDTEGHRTRGPGGDNTCNPGQLCDLPSYQIAIYNGHVYVDTRHTVPLGTRTPTP